MWSESNPEGGLPTGLMDAVEASNKLAQYKCPLTPERLVSLGESGYCPCWWWEFKGERTGPYFQISPLKQWIRRNGMLVQQSGLDFPKKLQVYLSAPPAANEALVEKDLPTALKGMALSVFPAHHAVSGVYFLIEDDSVVYVGQSVNVHARVGSHTVEDRKIFSRAVYLPVPREDLNAVERAFIRALAPCYNHEKIKASPSKNYEAVDGAALQRCGYAITCNGGIQKCATETESTE